MRAHLARRVALQAVQAMSYLHIQGVVHGGKFSSQSLSRCRAHRELIISKDSTPMNILFPLVNADTWPKHERLGEAIKSEVLTELGTPPWDASAPAYVVEPPSMSNLLSPSLLSSDILVIDFGRPSSQAAEAHHHHRHHIQRHHPMKITSKTMTAS